MINALRVAPKNILHFYMIVSTLPSSKLSSSESEEVPNPFRKIFLRLAMSAEADRRDRLRPEDTRKRAGSYEALWRRALISKSPLYNRGGPLDRC